MLPIAVTDMEVAFGGSPMLMPRYDAIPEEFRAGKGAAAGWMALIAAWRQDGVKVATGLVPSIGISPGLALRHVAAIINNRNIPADEATVAAAWLMSEWFSAKQA